MLPHSSTNFIIAIFRQSSLSMCQSRSSKKANLRLLDFAAANLFDTGSQGRIKVVGPLAET